MRCTAENRVERISGWNLRPPKVKRNEMMRSSVMWLRGNIRGPAARRPPDIPTQPHNRTPHHFVALHLRGSQIPPGNALHTILGGAAHQATSAQQVPENRQRVPLFLAIDSALRFLHSPERSSKIPCGFPEFFSARVSILLRFAPFRNTPTSI